MPAGRPRAITSHLAKKLFFLAGYGLTDAQLCEVFEISESTLNEYKKQVEFSESLKREKNKADLAVVNSLYKRAVGYDYEEEFATKDGAVKCSKVMHPDVTACIFWLKNRQRDNWRDKEQPVVENHFHVTTIQKLHQSMKAINTNGHHAANGTNGSNGHRPALSLRVD